MRRAAVGMICSLDQSENASGEGQAWNRVVWNVKPLALRCGRAALAAADNWREHPDGRCSSWALPN